MVSADGRATISNCNIFTDARKAEYSTGEFSVGIQNGGIATLIDTYVYGTHSGILTESGSKTYMIGGTTESSNLGGFYFQSGLTGEVYIEGAKIAYCDYKGLNQDFTYDSHNEGFSIASSNNTVYLNNCEITNPKGPAFVFDENSTNNTVYISNSTISKDHKVSINNNTNKLYIGKGCNFTEDDTNLPEVVTITNEVYTK